MNSHSSRAIVTNGLKQPTQIQRGPRQWISIWPCSRWGLPCHDVLPRVRCALTAPFHPYRQTEVCRRSTLCCTCRRLSPPRRYLAPCPMEPGLSSRSSKDEPATVRLTLARRLRSSGVKYKRCSALIATLPTAQLQSQIVGLFFSHAANLGRQLGGLGRCQFLQQGGDNMG